MQNFRFLRFTKLNSPTHDHSGIRENVTMADVGKESTGNDFDCSNDTHL